MTRWWRVALAQARRGAYVAFGGLLLYWWRRPVNAKRILSRLKEAERRDLLAHLRKLDRELEERGR